MVPNSGIFIFHEILQLDKFEGVYFNYDNSVLKFWPKNTQIEAFFRKTLQLGEFEGADVKYDNIIFKFQPKNTEIRHFWSQI